MKKDKHVQAVRDKLRDRERTGLRKYGVTTERKDLSELEWLNHAQQEAMDLAVYLEVLIQLRSVLCVKCGAETLDPDNELCPECYHAAEVAADLGVLE